MINDNAISVMEHYNNLLLKQGIDITSRTIFINEPISMKLFSRLNRQFLLLENFSKEPIELYLNTYGGDTDAMFAIMDLISTRSVHIHVIGTGTVYSAGVLILASGHTRSATKHTHFMHHITSFEPNYDRIPNQDSLMKMMKKREQQINNFLAKHTKKPYTFWSSQGKHIDHYFFVDDALEYGLIDGIME